MAPALFSLTLHKMALTIVPDLFEWVATNRQMLDARFWILDIQDNANSKIEKHPASRGQDPGSADVGNGLHHSDIGGMQDFMQP